MQLMAEAVYLIQEQSLAKEMPCEKFEAFLKGEYLLKEFALQLLRGAYLQISQSLDIVACVLFKIEIDEFGAPPEQWHVPFTQLCQNAGKRLDVGGGTVKVSTAKQCSVPWHQGKLWNFEEVPGIFDQLLQSVKANKLQHQFISEPSTGDGTDDSTAHQGRGKESIIEIQTPQTFGRESEAEPYRYAPGMYAAPMPHPNASMMHPGMMPVPDLMGQGMMQYLTKMQADHQEQLQNIEQQHQEHSEKLKTFYEEQLSNAEQECAQVSQKANKEIERLKASVNKLTSKKDSLQDICEAHQEQIHLLKQKVNNSRSSLEKKHQSDLDEISKKYERITQEKLEFERINWEKEIQTKEVALQSALKAVKNFQEDITDLRRDKIRLLSSGADQFFQNLERLGVSFIVFHAGVGHISLPLDEVSCYMDNPLAYAAQRCGVTQKQYELWLAHHDNTTCAFQIDDQQVCGAKLQRIESPAEYIEGESNRCNRHQSLTKDWQPPIVKQNH